MNEPLLDFYGDEWQDFGNSLIGLKYGPANYLRVPDKDKGDFGIEGVTTCGHVYQLYAPEEARSLSLTKKYELCRNKMTADIGKFIKNRDKLSKLFGSKKIRRWVLFTPDDTTKDIVAHCSKKTTEVKKADLPYVDNNDFEVIVLSKKDFTREIEEYFASPRRLLEASISSVDQGGIDDWASQNDSYANTIYEKVSKFPTIKGRPQKCREKRDSYIQFQIQSEDVQSQLQEVIPDLRLIVRRAIDHIERELVANDLEFDSAKDIYSATLTRIKDAITHELPRISEETCGVIAHGAIGEWMGRCPLDFPEVQ